MKRQFLLLLTAASVVVIFNGFAMADCRLGDNNSNIRITRVMYNAISHTLSVKFDRGDAAPVSFDGINSSSDCSGLSETNNVSFSDSDLDGHTISTDDLRALESVALTALSTGMNVTIKCIDGDNTTRYALYVTRP